MSENYWKKYWQARDIAEKMGATYKMADDYDGIYLYNQRAHMAPFCTTSGLEGGNTPYLIELDSESSLEDKYKQTKNWIIETRKRKIKRGW